MIEPAHPFARATFDLLMVIHDRQLPPPMSTRWSPFTQQLTVQVEQGHFLRYLDALSEATQTVSNRDHYRHYNATGVLRGAPETRVTLTSVSHLAVAA